MRDGWVETTLKQALEPIANRPNGKDYPLVLSVTEKRGIIPQTEIFKNRIATDDISKYKVIEPMDIAYNPYLLWCGAIGQWKGVEPGVVSPVYECFRVKNNCSPKFLGFIFEAGILTEYFNSRAIGSIVRRRRTIPADFIGAPILLPPLAEQKRIVDLISSVDSYIEALQKQVDKARKSRNAVLHELLTKGGDGWVETTLSEVADVIDPHPSHRAPPIDDEGIPFIGIGDLRRTGDIDFVKARRVSKEILEEHKTRYNRSDFLIGLGRVASIGMVVRLPDEKVDYAVSPTLAVIRAKDMLGPFLFYLLEGNYSQDQFQRFKKGSTRESVGMQILRKIKVHIPPLAEQKRIVEIISVFDNQIEALNSTIAKTKNLRSALLTDLLSGNHEIPLTYDKLIGAA